MKFKYRINRSVKQIKTNEPQKHVELGEDTYSTYVT